MDNKTLEKLNISKKKYWLNNLHNVTVTFALQICYE